MLRSRVSSRAALVFAWGCLLPVLAAQGASDLITRTSPITGRATFVTASDGGAIPVLPGAGAGVAVGARAGGASATPADALARYGHLFGIDNPATQLVVSLVDHDAIGHTHTTHEQIHNGVRVFVGVLKVHQDIAGQFVAINGDFFPVPPKLSARPTLTAAEAEAVATADLNAGTPAVEHAELVIVDPGWYGDPPVGPHLAYYIILNGAPDPVREGFFIEAHTGVVLDRWSMIHDAKDRQVYDGGGGSALPGTPARFEGDPAHANGEVNAAYDYAGDTYDYYWRAFGRDSIDDAGMPLVATVNSTAPQCPNAYWNGTQIVFCTGLVTDDVVAHELTHGVTQYTANLIYQNQSGQLNESFSDVFGELVDLFNGDAAFPGTPGGPPNWPTHPTGPGTDTPNNLRTACSSPPSHSNGVRWMIGEDIYAFPFNGALRDMWDPTCEGDPDRGYSPLQTCPWYDNGGVHSGSGIPNHAFAIVTDGKTFNGQVVTGIGPIKSGAVWYRTLTTYLTPAADFEDAYYAFNQAAQDLIGTYPNDPRTGLASADAFTASDAEQVDKALIAVEMNAEGACGASVNILDPEPPTQCYPKATIFFDDFESGANGWTVANTNPPTPYDWVQTSGSLPYGHTSTVWFCDDPSIGDCAGNDETGVHYLFSPVITMPTNLIDPTVAFHHYVATEPTYDGGNVRISVNGGLWQLIPGSAFTYNPYNTTITTDNNNTNPMAGEEAFAGAGGGWGTSLIDLSGFVSAGDTIQIRFDFGKDGCTGVQGWYIDDFEVYICPPTPTGTISGTVRDTYNSPVGDATVETSAGGYSTTTNISGQYTLFGVAVDTYDVTASKAGYMPQTVPAVEVTEDTTTTVDFNLEPLSNDATVTGQVTDGSSPVPSAIVHTDTGCHWATTDGNGDYTLADVAAGTYDVTAFKTGYDPQTNSNVVVASGATVTENFILPPASPFGDVNNGDFEAGFHNDPDVDHQVANSWGKFVLRGNPKYGPFWDGGNHSPYYAQTFYEADYIAGIYQQISGTKAGGLYTASAWIRGTNSDLRFWVGIDPNGGVNANSPNVQWNDSYQPGTSWYQHSHQAVAENSTITVFVKTQYPYPGTQNALIDDVTVTEDTVPETTIQRSPTSLTPSADRGTNAADQTFEVSNVGNGVLQYSVCDDAHWMWVEPETGDSTGPSDVDTVTVHYSTETMASGTYSGTVRITGPYATNNPQEIAITLTVGPGPTPDFDGDGDVDLEDFGHLQACLTGPDVPQLDPACHNARLDPGTDVDQDDFTIFQSCLSGPHVPADADCTD